MFPVKLDMIRLRVLVSTDFISRFFDSNKFSCSAMLGYDTQFYIGKGASQYGYNYRIQKGEPNQSVERPSFWIGFCHNSERMRKNITYFTMEYNPQKWEGDTLINYLLSEFFNKPNTAEIVSCDIAKDIDIHINDIIIDTQRKRDIKLFNSASGKTYYIGKGNKRVKVYDKVAEQLSKGNYIADSCLTRYEVSMSIGKTFRDIEAYMPDIDGVPVIYVPSQQLFISPLVKSLIFALQHGVIQFNELTRTQKRMVQDAKVHNLKVSLTTQEVSSVLTKYVLSVQGINKKVRRSLICV